MALALGCWAMKTNLSDTTPAATGRPVSPLSAQQWRNLETLAADASRALSALQTALVVQAGGTNDADLQSALMAQSDRVNDAWSKVSGLAYVLHPQPEWLGGTDGPSVLREPHLMGMRRLTVNG